MSPADPVVAREEREAAVGAGVEEDREFLCTGVAAACALGARRTWAQAATPPSKTITMAILGVGWRGQQMLPVFLNQHTCRRQPLEQKLAPADLNHSAILSL